MQHLALEPCPQSARPAPAPRLSDPAPTPRRPGGRQSRRISLPPLSRAPSSLSSSSKSDPTRSRVGMGIEMGRAEVSFGRTVKRTSIASYGRAGDDGLDITAFAAAAHMPFPPPASTPALVDAVQGMVRTSSIPLAPPPSRPPPTGGEDDEPIPTLRPSRPLATLTHRPFSSPAASEATLADSIRSRKRGQVARELVETERRYFGVLQTVKSRFFDPVQKALETTTGTGTGAGEKGKEKVLSKRTAQEVFANFEDVYGLSKTVLAALEDMAVRSRLFDDGEEEEEGTRRKEARVGQTLQPFVPFFKLYAPFARNFPRSQTALALHSSPTGPSPLFAALVSAPDADSNTTGGLSLAHLLLSIIQRVPRIELLLGQLLKYSDPVRDRDYATLDQVKRGISDVARQLNRAMREDEERVQILNIQARFDGEVRLLSPGRRLVRTGRVRVRSCRAGEWRQEKDKTAFLFSDRMVVATAKGDEGEGKRYAVWRDFGLDEMTAVKGGEVARKKGGTQRGIDVLLATESFTLFAGSDEETDAWLDAIRQTKSDHLGSRSTLLRPSPSIDDDAPAPTSTGMISYLSSPVLSSIWSGWLDGRPRASAAVNKLRSGSRPTSFARSADGTSSVEGEVRSNRSSARSSWMTSNGESTGPASSTATTDDGSLPSRPMSVTDKSDPDVAALAGNVDSESQHPASPPLVPLGPEFGSVVLEEDYNAPVWVPDDEATKCTGCATPFGVFVRRHHCRLCGAVFCSSCSTKTFFTSSTEDKPVRACDPCYLATFDTVSSTGPGGAERTPVLSAKLQDKTTLGRHFAKRLVPTVSSMGGLEEKDEEEEEKNEGGRRETEKRPLGMKRRQTAGARLGHLLKRSTTAS